MVCRPWLVVWPADMLVAVQFVLRHCNFLALMRPGNAYSELLSGTDFAMMPWLRKFQVCPKDHAGIVEDFILQLSVHLACHDLHGRQPILALRNVCLLWQHLPQSSSMQCKAQTW